MGRGSSKAGGNAGSRRAGLTPTEQVNYDAMMDTINLDPQIHFYTVNNPASVALAASHFNDVYADMVKDMPKGASDAVYDFANKLSNDLDRAGEIAEKSAKKSSKLGKQWMQAKKDLKKKGLI